MQCLADGLKAGVIRCLHSPIFFLTLFNVGGQICRMKVVEVQFKSQKCLFDISPYDTSHFKTPNEHATGADGRGDRHEC